MKIKKPGQRSCNEKDAKGKFCGGHLKRWFYTTDVVEQACGDAEKAWGPDAEVYRCEHCKTLYLPNPEGVRGLECRGTGADVDIRVDRRPEEVVTQKAVSPPTGSSRPLNLPVKTSELIYDWNQMDAAQLRPSRPGPAQRRDAARRACSRPRCAIPRSRKKFRSCI